MSSYWVSRLDWTLAWVEIPSRRWKSFKLISKPSEEQKIYSTRSCKCALANEAEIISQIALCKIEWSFLGDRYRVIRKEDVFFHSSKAANSLWLIFQIGKWKIVKHRRGVTILIFSEKNHLKKVYASLGMWNVQLVWTLQNTHICFKYIFLQILKRNLSWSRISKCTKGGAKFIFGNAFWHCAWRQSRENSSTANMLRNMWKATKATQLPLNPSIQSIWNMILKKHVLDV